AQGLEQAVAVGHGAVAGGDGVDFALAAEDAHAHPGTPSARSMPRALARVSSSSRSGSESATMPAPVRKRSRLPPGAPGSSSALRIRMLRSRSPSRLSQPKAPV